jgi:hypothetical protein
VSSPYQGLYKQQFLNIQAIDMLYTSSSPPYFIIHNLYERHLNLKIQTYNPNLVGVFPN